MGIWREFPEPDGAVGAYSEQVTGGIKFGTNKDIVVQQGRGDRRSVGCVPHTSGIVITGGDDVEAIETERHVSDGFFVVKERGDSLPSLRIPDSSGSIQASGYDSATIGTESNGSNGLLMFPGAVEELAGVGVP